MSSAVVDGAEVSKHNSKRSCWLVINSAVYDVTHFLRQHPGGEAVLLRQAGGDASTEFNKVHPADYVDDLPAGSRLGDFDSATSSSLAPPKRASPSSGSGFPAGPAPPLESSPPPPEGGGAPDISLCVRASDFEAAARHILSRKSWVYVSSSANAGLSLKGNLDDWSRLNFRPRVLRNVENVDMRSSILGHATPYPFYVSPMGSLGMSHSAAEPELMKGIVRKGIHGVVSTASTKPPNAIMQSFVDQQQRYDNASPSKLFFQYYMPPERSKAVELLLLAKKVGYKGLWITVDLPVLGKRTEDKRLQAEEVLSFDTGEGAAPSDNAAEDNPFSPGVGGRVIATQIKGQVTWDDLKWIRQSWEGPIVLKGIQCAEDAKLAMEHGLDGILLSNHGGRQLHTAPSALMTLLEIRTYCPEVLQRIEVYVDGGLRDGADVLKAICLGAKSVGVGRPFFYALAAYGAAGVEKCIDILADEVETAMRLLGITSLDQARPELVNASRLLNEMWRPELPPLYSRL